MPSLIRNNRVNVPSISSTIETMTLSVQAHGRPKVKPTPITTSTMTPAIIIMLSKEDEAKIDKLWLINQKPAIKLKNAIS